MTDRLKDILDKIPFGFVTLLVLGWYGWQFHQFREGADSPLAQKKAQVETLNHELGQLKTKIKAAEDFRTSLNARRSQLQQMAKRLDEMKATVSENLDVADFMKTVITEAKIIGLGVQKLEPQEIEKKDFYVQHPFRLSFRGVFVQVLVFLERMSNVQKIVRVDNFEIKALGAGSSRYVELEGTIELRTYRYLASSADGFGRDGGAAPPPAPKEDR